VCAYHHVHAGNKSENKFFLKGVENSGWLVVDGWCVHDRQSIGRWLVDAKKNMLSDFFPARTRTQTKPSPEI
jgi:hypothetical protein